MKKQLIYTNDEMLKAILSDINKFAPALNELKKAYEALEMGAFTDTAFTELKSSINSTLTAYNKNLEKQLDASGVKNSKLREGILQGSEQPIADLRTAFNNLVSIYITPNPYQPHRSKVLDLNDICFRDGTFQVYSVEEIKEKYCTVYIEDEEDQEIYQVLENTKKSLDQFALMATIRGLKFGIHGSGLDIFFTIQNGKLTINPYSIELAKNHLSSQEAIYIAEQKRMAKQSEIRRQNDIRAGFIN